MSLKRVKEWVVGTYNLKKSQTSPLVLIILKITVYFWNIITLSDNSRPAVILMGRLTVIMVFYVTRIFTGMWFPVPLFITDPCGYGKAENIAYDFSLFRTGICFHIFREISADTSDQFIHICLVSVLVMPCIDRFINDAVGFCFDQHRKIGKEYRNPKLLLDGVLWKAVEIGQADFLLYELVLFFDRPNADIFLMPIFLDICCSNVSSLQHISALII